MDGPTMRVDSYVLDNMRARARQSATRKRDMERNLESSRQRAYAAAEELRRLSTAGSQDIQREIEAETRKLMSEVDSIREDFGRALGQQNLKMRREFNELRASIYAANVQMDSLDKKIDSMAKKFDAELKTVIERIAGQKDRAQVYLNQLDTLLSQADALNANKLAHDTIQQLHESARFVKANIANSDYQAAIGLSQSSILDTITLIAELQRLNAEFDDLSIRAQEACLSVSNRLTHLLDAKANEKTIRLRTGSDEWEYTYEGDIAFWTSGIFTQLYDAYAQDEVQILEEFLPQMDIENLKIAVEAIPRYNPRIDSCVKLADDEFSISCAVQNMAVQIFNALSDDNTWQLDESGFENKDMRLSFMESFTDSLGNTIEFVILPSRVQTRAGVSETIIFSLGTFSTDSSEGMQSILRNAVLGRLESAGIDIRTGLKQSTSARCGGQDNFTRSEYVAGSKIKKSRLDYVRKEIVPANYIEEEK